MATPLGEKIRAQRKRLSLTMEELAARTESSKSYIWDLENRPVVRPSADKIKRIADALGVSVEFLIDEEKSEMTRSEADEVFFRKIGKLDASKRTQLERFLKAIEGEDE